MLQSNTAAIKPLEPNQIISCQLAIVAALAGFTLLSGLPNAIAILVGGLAAIVPNALFAFCLFRRPYASQAIRFVCLFFFGEFLKLFISALLVVAAACYLPTQLLAVLSGFVAAYFSCWLLPLWARIHNRGC